MSLKKESPADLKLHRAAVQGDLATLQKVLDSGKVHVDCRDEDGTTPLILASANCHFECVVELLEQGADPQAKRITGTTALFFAAQTGNVAITRLLLKNGALVDSVSMDGGTPLVVACQYGHMDVIKELVNAGANVHIEMKDRATPLFIAAQNGHLKVSLYLLAKGANVDSRRMDGATPLWIASQMGHSDIVKHLLYAGAQVDAARNDGATPLFKAAHKGHEDVVYELLRAKPNVGLLMNGESAVHAAALFNHKNVLQKLINAGANPRLRNQDGQTPIQLALHRGHIDIVSYLDHLLPTIKRDPSTDNPLGTMTCTSPEDHHSSSPSKTPIHYNGIARNSPHKMNGSVQNGSAPRHR